MSEAEQRYLGEIADDCRTLLGAGIELDGLSVEVGNLIVVAASYHVAAHAARTVGRGDTIVAAHADLRRRLVEDRLGLAFAALVDPNRTEAGAARR